MTARRLVLLRHAKAENPAGTADEDRPLSTRGRADARSAGTWLAQQVAPDLVLCSPSRRTRQTWQAVAALLPAGATPAVSYPREIYTGGPEDLLDLVQAVAEPTAAVLLIGHNPTISQLALSLDPGGPLAAGGLRTCGLTVHAVGGPWAAVGTEPAPIRAIHTARADR